MQYEYTPEQKEYLYRAGLKLDQLTQRLGWAKAQIAVEFHNQRRLEYGQWALITVGSWFIGAAYPLPWLVLYFLIAVAIGIWVYWGSKKKEHHKFFLTETRYGPADDTGADSSGQT